MTVQPVVRMFGINSTSFFDNKIIYRRIFKWFRKQENIMRNTGCYSRLRNALNCAFRENMIQEFGAIFAQQNFKYRPERLL